MYQDALALELNCKDGTFSSDYTLFHFAPGKQKVICFFKTGKLFFEIIWSVQSHLPVIFGTKTRKSIKKVTTYILLFWKQKMSKLEMIYYLLKFKNMSDFFTASFIGRVSIRKYKICNKI